MRICRTDYTLAKDYSTTPCLLSDAEAASKRRRCPCRAGYTAVVTKDVETVTG